MTAFPPLTESAGQPISLIQRIQPTHLPLSVLIFLSGLTMATQGDLKMTAFTPLIPAHSFTAAVEAKQVAQQNKLKAETEAQQKVIEAEAEAKEEAEE